MQSYVHQPSIVWLDTNVVIDIKNAIIKDKKDSRAYKLFQTLRKNVSVGRIICPFVYQRDEYQEDKANLKVADRVLAELSNGKQISIVREEIAHKQIKRMFKVFLGQVDDFWLEDEDIFNEALNSGDNTSPIKIIVIHSGGARSSSPYSVDQLFNHLKRRKREYVKVNTFTQEQIYKEEINSRYDLFSKKIKEYDNKDNIPEILSKLPKMSIAYSILYPAVALLEITEEFNLEIIRKFFRSDYYYKIPIEDIESRLVAKLLTSNSNLKKTDLLDIESISIILPYASYIMTDKSMKGNIKQTQLNKKYNTKVYSLKQWKEMLGDITEKD